MISSWSSFSFCFEQWEVFEALNDSVLHYLRVRINCVWPYDIKLVKFFLLFWAMGSVWGSQWQCASLPKGKDNLSMTIWYQVGQVCLLFWAMGDVWGFQWQCASLSKGKDKLSLTIWYQVGQVCLLFWAMGSVWGPQWQRASLPKGKDKLCLTIWYQVGQVFPSVLSNGRCLRPSMKVCFTI